MSLLDEFGRLFINRDDVYAEQLAGKGYVKVEKPVTLDVIKAHLAGVRTVGTYQLNPKSEVKWLVFDLDPDHLDDPRDTTEKILSCCLERIDREAILLEASRHPDPSFHIWIFFDPEFPAKAARWLGLRILDFADVDPKNVEVFPKQTRLTKNRPFGNLVKLPLGWHRVQRKWSKFLDLEAFCPLSSDVIHNVRGIAFSERDTERIVGFGEKRGVRARFELPKNFKPLRDEEEERAVEFLIRYWKPGYRNQLELSFLGWCIKRGINHDSACRIIEEVANRTCDEEKASRLRLVHYHYKNRLTVPLKGKSGLREIVEELIQGGE